jgi:Protein of unknown function (DUF1131)
VLSKVLTHCKARKPRSRSAKRGVGPITEATPFSISAIGKLLPTLRVVAGISSAEGIEFPTILVLDGAAELFIVAPNENRTGIASIVVTSGKIVYTGKGRIGARYSEVFGQTIPKDCSPGVEEDSGKVICRAPSSRHVHFVFSGANVLETLKRAHNTTMRPTIGARWFRLVKIIGLAACG